MGLAYLNGEFMDVAEAKISPLDRGFLFGDGVYEVVPVYDGQFFRMQEHLARLERSLEAISLKSTHTLTRWQEILSRIVGENGTGDQAVYIQITRGAPLVRQHIFSDTGATATYFATSWPFKTVPIEQREGGSAITLTDTRWGLCHIKSVNLLANILAMQQAHAQGHKEAILIREEHVVEATSSNVFMVKDNILITPPKTEYMLGGITREVILELATAHHIGTEIRHIHHTELTTADEIWVSSSTKEAWPIIELDQKAVGDGKIGPLWRQMIHYYQNAIHGSKH